MAIDIEEDEEDAFDFPNTLSDTTKQLIIWMMQPKRKKRPQSVDEVLEKLDHQPTTQKMLIQTPEEDSEETIVIGSASIAKEENIVSNTDESQGEEARTILVISKEGDKKTESYQTPLDILPQRAVKVGDFIFEDGSYSTDPNGKKVVGVLFSYYGGAHGQILSPVKPSENISINGKKLEWHTANIGEWVEIIQNLGHCKVNFVSWDYKYYSNEVKDILRKYHITESRYTTRKSVNGVAYIVSLERCTMIPMEDCGPSTPLPYIYISEF